MLELAEKGIDQGESPKRVITDDIHRNIAEKKYGHEVIKHTQEGDICVENDLHHLAISSYIHAIEWAIISFLEDKEGKDIIEEEKSGKYYNFAGGQRSLLKELNKIRDIDQKTISKINSMNRAERRWMAHHKSGEVLPEEVTAIRARLRSILNELHG
jgi:hypothetical protein